MMSTLPTKSMVIKKEIMPNKETNNDGKVQIKVSRKTHKIKTMEKVLPTTIINGVERYKNVTSIKPNVNHHNQETSSPLQATTTTSHEVTALIKKHLGRNLKLMNSNNSQQQQQPPPPEQQLPKQQVNNQLEKQQRLLYKKQQQEALNRQQLQLEFMKQQYQQQQQKYLQEKQKQQQQKQLQQQHQQQKQNHYDLLQQQPPKQQNHKYNNSKTLTLLKCLNKLGGNSTNTMKIQQTQSQEQIKEKEHQNTSTRLSEPSPQTANSTKKIRHQRNTHTSELHLLNHKMKSQNSRINLLLNNHKNNNNNNEWSGDVNNNHNNNNSNHLIQHSTTSGEYTINRQGVPTISNNNNSEDIHCYEERLKRIEEQINCYRDEVESYANDNLYNLQQKLQSTNKSIETMPEVSVKMRATTNCKQCSNNSENSIYSHKITNKINYNANSSSSHCSSESDSPPMRTKPSTNYLPVVYSNNSFYQLAAPSLNKRKSEIGTGGSGDNINRHLETSFHDFQQHESEVQKNQQRLIFKRSVANLLKTHLQVPKIITTMQQTTPVQTPNVTACEYRYKSSSRRKTTKVY